jgi:hypothetical protein
VTIARFRVRHEQALAGFLVESLRLCAAAGLVRLGVVALDGTRVADNAADRSNRTWPSSRRRSPRSCERPPRPTRLRITSTARRAATSSRPSWPPPPGPRASNPGPHIRPRRRDEAPKPQATDAGRHQRDPDGRRDPPSASHSAGRLRLLVDRQPDRAPRCARAVDSAGQARPPRQAPQGRQAVGVPQRRAARGDDRQARQRRRRDPCTRCAGRPSSRSSARSRSSAGRRGSPAAGWPPARRNGSSSTILHGRLRGLHGHSRPDRPANTAWRARR